MTVCHSPASNHGEPDGESMATVIPLKKPDRDDKPAPPAATTASAPDPHHPIDGDPLARALDLLQRQAGDLGPSLPSTLGAAALRIESLLAAGPTGIDGAKAQPARAIATAAQVLTASASLLELISEEVTVLGEALSVELGSTSLLTIHDVADATLGLATAPQAAPHWGHRSSADAAELVLEALADDLREAASSHDRLYHRFTEGILQVPAPLLRAGRRRWRLIARFRLRRQLCACSRSDRVGSITAAAKDVLAVRALRERIGSLSSLLEHHLALLDCGPLSDVDSALTSLRAVRRLQATLGDALDGDRLQQLLLADAFRSHDVNGPASRVRNGIRAWRTDVLLAGGVDSRLGLDELADWTADCVDLLPALVDGHDATQSAGVSTPTLESLVDLLLVREHVEELIQAQAMGEARRSWSAS